MIVVGCDLESTRQAIEIAEQNDGVYAAVGFHPHDAKKMTDQIWRQLCELGRNEKVVAIGETGLDYYRDMSPRHIQKEVFIKHIDLAKQLNKPLIVHNREADKDSLQVLKDQQIKDVVFHCFGSNVQFAREVWMAGFFTSFTGNITYPNAHMLREVVGECPLDAMMVETDCPYLTPQKYRKQTNEPAFVKEVANEIAYLKSMSFEDVAKITTRNAEQFFNL
jgi:TatD DNase family protein